MKLLCALLVSLAALLPGAGRARASSHEVPKIKAIKEKGQVVGAEITVLLKPAGHGSPIVGLGRPGKYANLHTPQSYMYARDKKLGYVIQELGTVETHGPTEQTFKLFYGKGNRLKAGDRVEVYSLWQGTSAAHLWGVNRTAGIDEKIYTLPGK